MRLRRSLSNRLIISYAALTLTVLILLGTVFYVLMDDYASKTEAASSHLVKDQVVTQLYQFMLQDPDIGELQEYTETLEQLQGVELSLLDMQGDPIFEVYAEHAVFSLSVTPNVSAYLEMNMVPGSGGRMNMASTWSFFNREPQGAVRKQREVVLRELMNQGELQFTVAGSPQQGTIRIETNSVLKTLLVEPAVIAFGLSAVLVLILAVLLGWRISRTLTKPVSALSRAVQQMSAGDLTARAFTSSQDEEIDVLSSQINDLAAKLQSTIEDLNSEKEALKRFLLDASHELRTPVTALSMYLEMLEGSAGDDPERRKSYIETCITQNDRSRSIVVKLLELIKLEKQDERREKTAAEMLSILDEARAIIQSAADEKQTSLHMKDSVKGSQALVSVDHYQIVTAVKNLLENAVKYSPEGSTVTMDVSVQGDALLISVIDEGSGISEEDSSRIFDRFYRSRSAGGTGSGLGLAIVKQIAENHGGTLSFTNREDREGTVFSLTLPCS